MGLMTRWWNLRTGLQLHLHSTFSVAVRCFGMLQSSTGTGTGLSIHQWKRKSSRAFDNAVAKLVEQAVWAWPRFSASWFVCSRCVTRGKRRSRIGHTLEELLLPPLPRRRRRRIIMEPAAHAWCA